MQSNSDHPICIIFITNILAFLVYAVVNPGRNPEALTKGGRGREVKTCPRGEWRWPMVSVGGRHQIICHYTLISTLWPVAMFFITIWISCTAPWIQFSPWTAALLSTPIEIYTIDTLSTVSSGGIILIIRSDRASVRTLPALSSRVISAVKYR